MISPASSKVCPSSRRMTCTEWGCLLAPLSSVSSVGPPSSSAGKSIPPWPPSVTPTSTCWGSLEPESSSSPQPAAVSAKTLTTPTASAQKRLLMVCLSLCLSDRSDSVEALDDHRLALAAGDAHRLEADLVIVGLHDVQEGAHDPGARHAERVAQGDRTAVGV